MNILDGKEVSRVIQGELQEEVAALKEKTGLVPGLTVVIVGEDPASQIYVKSKDKAAAKLGIESHVIRLDSDISKEDLSAEIKKLNEDTSVHGILVQLPLPDKFDEWEILDQIDPRKDVDRFHPQNLGMLMLKRTDIFPCTPFGVLKSLDHYNIDVSGMDAVVVGRSYIVGKPMAGLLTNRNATVTVCHSRTKDLAGIIKRADLVVAAIGRPGYITADMVKEGAVLIDVGINRLDNESDVQKFCTQSQKKRFTKKGYGITGDIHIDAFEKSSWYTPVPGGIGTMTVTMLMHNTIELFKQNLQG